jgi:hypothetical protein
MVDQAEVGDQNDENEEKKTIKHYSMKLSKRKLYESVLE